MKHLLSIACAILVCHSLPAAARPNIFIILADDLGFSDIGCYGSEIDTPELDALARNGLRFTGIHNTGRCWPSRAALMTGYYAQQIRRDRLPEIPGGTSRSTPSPKTSPDTATAISAAGIKSAKNDSRASVKWPSKQAWNDLTTGFTKLMRE